ncbi:MAG: hypothetical protein ACYC0U_00295 [Ilumatobacteraceae bacterium]
MSDSIRRAPVGLSTEALCEAWARQEHALSGSIQILDREIAGRVRGGQAWTALPAFAVSVIVRPNIDLAQAEMGWMSASLAAAEALEHVGLTGITCLWPDVVSGVDSKDNVLARVTARSHLGPGVISFCVLTARFDLSHIAQHLGQDVSMKKLEEAVIGSLRQQAILLEGPGQVGESYAKRCGSLGRTWQVNLLPKGYARGVASTIDDCGSLVIESGTGMREVITVDALKDIVPVT